MSKAPDIATHYAAVAEDLRVENENLKEELADRTRESLQVVEFLRKEIDKKQAAIEGISKAFELEKDQLVAQYMTKEQAFLNEIEAKDKLIIKLQAENTRLQADVAVTAQFRKEKHDMELEIQRLVVNEATTKETHEKELSKLKFQAMEERVRLKNQEQLLEQHFQQDVEKQAYSLLDEKTKSIYHQNQALLKDKHVLEKELEQLSILKKAAEENRRRKHRELELNQESMQMYAKQGYRLHREIKELTLQNKHLENVLNTTIAEARKKEETIRVEFEAMVNDLSYKLTEALRTLELRTTELQKIRALAKHIVQGRTELESFFNEALEFVKAQIEKEKSEQSKSGSKDGKIVARPGAPPPAPKPLALPSTDAPQQQPRESNDGLVDESLEYSFSFAQDGSFEPILQEGQDGSIHTPPPRDTLPPISSPMQQAESSLTRGARPGKLDISHLSWGDKERVLRILFAKLNSVVQIKRVPQRRRPEEQRSNSNNRHQITFITQT